MKCRTIVPAVLGVGLLFLATASNARAFDLLVGGGAAQKGGGACQKGEGAGQKGEGACQKGEKGACQKSACEPCAPRCRKPLFDGCWLRSRACAPKGCEPCVTPKGEGACQKNGGACQKGEGACQKGEGACQKGGCEAKACRPRLMDRIRAHRATACCEPCAAPKGEGACQKGGEKAGGACQKGGAEQK